MTRRLTSVLAALLAAAWPGFAWACAYCSSSPGKASAAYFWTALGLGFLPIGFGGGLWLWLRARYRKAAPRAEAEREASRRAA